MPYSRQPQGTYLPTQGARRTRVREKTLPMPCGGAVRCGATERNGIWMKSYEDSNGQLNRQRSALHWCCRGAGGPLQRRRDWLQRTRRSPPAHRWYRKAATVPKGDRRHNVQRSCMQQAARRAARSMHAQRTQAHPTIEVRVDLVHDTQRLLQRPTGIVWIGAAHARWYADATVGGACGSESS